MPFLPPNQQCQGTEGKLSTNRTGQISMRLTDAFQGKHYVFSALTPLVGRQEEHLACVKYSVMRWWHGCVWSEIQMICI